MPSRVQAARVGRTGEPDALLQPREVGGPVHQCDDLAVDGEVRALLRGEGRGEFGEGGIERFGPT